MAENSEIKLYKIFPDNYNFLTGDIVYNIKNNILIIDNIFYSDKKIFKCKHKIKYVKYFNKNIYVLTFFKNKSFLSIIDYDKLFFVYYINSIVLDFCISTDNEMIAFLHSDKIILIKKNRERFYYKKNIVLDVNKKVKNIFFRNKNELFVVYIDGFYFINVLNGDLTECFMDNSKFYQESKYGKIHIMSNNHITSYHEDFWEFKFFSKPKNTIFYKISNDSSTIFFICKNKNNICFKFGFKTKNRDFDIYDIFKKKIFEKEENINKYVINSIDSIDINQNGKWFSIKEEEEEEKKTYIYQIQENHKISNCIFQILISKNKDSSLKSFFTDLCDVKNLLLLVKNYM
jgi:hypothetical protein